MRAVGAGIAVAIMFVAALAMAQSPEPGSSERGEGAKPPTKNMAAIAGIITAQRSGQLLARNIFGSVVVSRDGKKVGEVKDLILDSQGQIAGVVFLSGGFMGIGGKSVAVSNDWVRIEPTANLGPHGGQVVLVRLTTQEIANAPGFRTLEDMQNTPSSQ